MLRTLLISMFLTSTALADTWTVDDDGKADFDNIQAAVDASSDGDEIVVMPGTYTSTQDGHVVNMLGKAVTLRSSDPSDPDVVAATIIDGEDTRRGLYCNNGETSKTQISGFTITNGFAKGGGAGSGGGGILIVSSTPFIQLCVISNNVCNGAGGGISLVGSGTIIRDCIIRDNSTLISNGAGIDCWYSSPTIQNCSIHNNFAWHFGGALSCGIGSTPSFYGCDITNNSAGVNGGALYTYSLGFNITNSVICGNSPNNIVAPCTPDCTGFNDGGGNTITDICEDQCPDINGDGTVNVSDVLIVIAYWGSPGSPADLNQDGIVDVSDLLMVVGNWGPCE